MLWQKNTERQALLPEAKVPQVCLEHQVFVFPQQGSSPGSSSSTELKAFSSKAQSFCQAWNRGWGLNHVRKEKPQLRTESSLPRALTGRSNNYYSRVRPGGMCLFLNTQEQEEDRGGVQSQPQPQEILCQKQNKKRCVCRWLSQLNASHVSMRIRRPLDLHKKLGT